MVACFRYATIDVHSVHLPPTKLDFNYEPLDWIQKEANEVRLVHLSCQTFHGFEELTLVILI